MRQLQGFKFRRQATIGPYIADFVSFEAKLIIEVDGGHHAGQKAKDSLRTSWLNKQGFRVLRFWDTEVLKETRSVLEAIWKELPPHLNPPPQDKMNEPAAPVSYNDVGYSGEPEPIHI